MIYYEIYIKIIYSGNFCERVIKNTKKKDIILYIFSVKSRILLKMEILNFFKIKIDKYF